MANLLAERLGDAPNIALVRVWQAPRDAGVGATSPLTLIAAAGELVPAVETHAPAFDGRLRGGARGEAVLRALGEDVHDRGELDWARAQGLRGYASAPMIAKGRWVGGVELFTWSTIAREGPGWLRVLADRVAVAVVSVAMQSAGGGDDARGTPPVAADRATPGLAPVLARLRRVAGTDATVLLTGESGVGKEVLAEELHRASHRSAGPLVRVNCASIPRELFESEFFGHAKGSFTGAARDRIGHFEAADGGTLFLDEVGELPIDLQAKLLRALQESRVERVGESVSRLVDVRIVAATNRDLEREVSRGNFREDLYWRLCVYPIEIPALRERPQDVPVLAARFVTQLAAELGRPGAPIGEAGAARLVAHAWPGNVRELRHRILRELIDTDAGDLEFVALDSGAPRPPASVPVGEAGVWTSDQLQALERDNLLRALRFSGGKVAGPGGAAELLGTNSNTLASRLRRLGLAAGGSAQGPTGPADPGR
ncbi:Formate hydrogenlyase transcriptional activator [Planctomycetes bacterium Pla86]|uniref:Formate hydrogenlyase transcriptional activator n=2 Tax=Engelhardtia mirabilis TaxID=2528011 RepID=A0A518BPK2_9BACT|nr:Formate hydrogenlyase transcriptional activator [Planctomycetes bacterium Pla133]QDV03239.1 Formate hydrogenlyase transcriptional activator [Planctomycetes bacterium Pla86]